MELNQIQSSSLSWGEAASSLNQNFSKIGTDMEKMRYATTRNKGYFSSGDALKKAVESAVLGDIAYVKHETLIPYEVWEWTVDGWVGTGIAGGDESISLGDYYNKEDVDTKFENHKVKIATDEVVGGIIAEEKTELDVTEVKIDPATGKLYTPGITVEGDITPDEEDLTATIEEGKAVVRFRDREAIRGKGYLILRSGKSAIEQITKENTIYEIRYDFDLDGETLKVPANCVLEFKGGSFGNGTLTGQDTGIIANPTKIFGAGLSVSGTWQIDFAYAEWFGAVADGSTDCWNAITKALNLPPYNCKLLKGVYCISKTIELSDKKKLSGQQGDTTLIKPTTGATMDCMILVGESTNDNFSVYGHLRDLGIERAPNIGLKCYGATQGFNIESIDIKWSGGAALVVSKCWYSTYRNINCWYNNYGLILCDADNISGDTAVNGVKFDNCWFNHNTAGSVYSNGFTTAVSFNACTFENSKTVGNPEIKCEHFYTDMTFNSCYMETNRCGFDIKSDYRVGNLSIFGGIYTFGKPTTPLAKIGKVDTFNVIGSMWIVNDVSAMSGKCIDSEASVNNTSSRFPDSPNVWNATGNVVSFNLSGGYYDKYFGCHSRSWQTNSLKVTHDGFAKDGCSASFYLGINRPKVHGYPYGLMGLKFEVNPTGTETRDTARIRVVRSNYDASDTEESSALTINHYGDVNFGNRVRGHIAPHSGTSRPAYSAAHIGMMYFDTSLGKPIFMKGDGVWVDATGAQV